MRSVIQQSVVLPAAAEALFEMYLHPAVHAAITGTVVTRAEESGSEFLAFEGMLSGTMLTVVRPRLIIQSWRSGKINVDDSDSALILTFTPQEDIGRIDLIHLDVPEHDYDDVCLGWEKYYWIPWRRYLESR